MDKFVRSTKEKGKYGKKVLPGANRRKGTKRSTIEKDPANPDEKEVIIEFSDVSVANDYEVIKLASLVDGVSGNITHDLLPYYYRKIIWLTSFQIKKDGSIPDITDNYLVLFKKKGNLLNWKDIQFVCYDGRGPAPNGLGLFEKTAYEYPFDPSYIYISLNIGDPSVGITKPD